MDPSSPSPRVEDPFSGHDWSSRSPRLLVRSVSNSSATSQSSIGWSLDTTGHRRGSTVVESCQNEISTLLQPPISHLPHTAIRSTSQKPPTSLDIPPVTLTALPKVEPSAFKDYPNQVGGLFEAFRRSKLDSEDGGVQVFRQDNSAAKDDEISPWGRRKTSVSKHGQLVPTPLSTIPSVYFEENFRLENPRTFDVVTEHSEVVKQPLFTIGDGYKTANAANGNPQRVRKALATNAILQEKISWYIDTVEIHLIPSISQASASFSAALTSLSELQAGAAESLARIQKLRNDLAHLDKEIAVGGFEIISKKQRRDNLKKLGEATIQLQCVLSGTSYCEKLVDSGQLETALHHISYVEQLASGTLDSKIGGTLPWLLSDPFIRLIDLRQLHALEGLSRDINQLRLRIGKEYEARLLDILLCDLRRHVSIVPPRDTLARWMDAAKRARGATDTSSSTPVPMMNGEKLREELIPVLQGLGQSQHLAAASTTFREAIIREMKSLIRQHLLSFTDDDNESVVSVSTRTSGRRLTQQQKSNILSRNLRALSPEDAEEFFVKVCCGISEALRRLGVQVKVLLDISSGMNQTPSNLLTPAQRPGSMDNSAIRSPVLSMGCNLQEEMAQTLDLSSLLDQAVDKAQSETIKVLRVRTEQTVRLGLTDFLNYFTLNRLFVIQCEAVSGHSGAALKGLVNDQINDFVLILHEIEKQKLARRMESEKWERIDFKPEDAVILTHIVQSMTTDPPAWLSYTDTSAVGLEAGEQDLQTNCTPVEPTSAAKQDKKGPTPAVIEEGKFILVDSAAFALRSIEQYTILLSSVPSIANDISMALLEYLKLFNSRTQQLILGAGAKITAGLININTKHLALASQSLSFFIALIPYLRECVRRRPSISGSSIQEYDQLKRLFKNHQSSIHDKVIDIMSFRATVCIRAMEKIKWDDVDEVQRKVSPHMETLTKEALTLQRVLSKYLPALSVRMIVERVFVSYTEQWSKAFEGAAIQTEAGQARLLRDAELLEAKLGKIDGGEEFGLHMVNIVKAKQVASQPKASTNTPSGKGTLV